MVAFSRVVTSGCFQLIRSFLGSKCSLLSQLCQTKFRLVVDRTGHFNNFAKLFKCEECFCLRYVVLWAQRP